MDVNQSFPESWYTFSWALLEDVEVSEVLSSPLAWYTACCGNVQLSQPSGWTCRQSSLWVLQWRWPGGGRTAAQVFVRGRRCPRAPGAAAVPSRACLRLAPLSGEFQQRALCSRPWRRRVPVLVRDRNRLEKFQCNIFEQTLHRLCLVHWSLFLTAVAGIIALFLRAAFNGLDESLGRQWKL